MQCVLLFFPIQFPIILTYNIPSYRSSPFFQKIINSLNMSRSTIADSHFGVYATDYNFMSNSSLVNFHSHPLPTGSDLPQGQMASLDYDPAHAYPGCQGYFEWEGEVKTAKCSCWGCGARDEYCYRVEPIVEGTNVSGKFRLLLIFTDHSFKFWLYHFNFPYSSLNPHSFHFYFPPFTT